MVIHEIQYFFSFGNSYIQKKVYYTTGTLCNIIAYSPVNSPVILNRKLKFVCIKS